MSETPTRLVVCTKCHLIDSEEDALPFPERDGGKLLAAMRRLVKAENLPVKVQGSKCIGCCDVNQKCGAFIETPGKDTQVLGGLQGEAHSHIVMAYLKAHLATRKRVRSKKDLPDPSWAKYFLIRIPGRHLGEDADLTDDKE